MFIVYSFMINIVDFVDAMDDMDTMTPRCSFTPKKGHLPLLRALRVRFFSLFQQNRGVGFGEGTLVAGGGNPLVEALA